MSTATVDPPAAERRRAPRRQPAMGTVCRLDAAPGEDLQVGLVWNISHGGISLLFPKSMEQGAMLKGELRAMSHPVKLPVTMRVAHVSKLMTGDYVLGCQFEKPLTAEELSPFVG